MGEQQLAQMNENKQLAAIMVFCGWSEQEARGAIKQWRQNNPTWNAGYIYDYLSGKEKAKADRIAQYITENTRESPYRPTTCLWQYHYPDWHVECLDAVRKETTCYEWEYCPFCGLPISVVRPVEK